MRRNIDFAFRRISSYFPKEEYRKYEKKGFATFSGKVELVPSILKKIGIDPLPRYVEPPRSPISTPDLAKVYPLILISGSRVIHYYHSCFRQLKKLRELYPNPLLQIHPETASKLKEPLVIFEATGDNRSLKCKLK